jgi:hypothetical protein
MNASKDTLKILEKWLEEIEPVVDINLLLKKMDHNNGIDIVFARLKEFQYESTGVKYQINNSFKTSDLKLDSKDQKYYINLNILYKNRSYCDIVKNLTVRNSITNKNINYEIIHRNKDKEIVNKYMNMKNIPICNFFAGEQIFIKLIDVPKQNEGVNINFYGILLKNEVRSKISNLEFETK